MRLIDADEFKKSIAGMAIINNYPPTKANALCELIDTQPTVYDIDGVVEALKELEVKAITRYKGDFGDFDGVNYYIKKSDAIEIVKQGGVRKEVN